MLPKMPAGEKKLLLFPCRIHQTELFPIPTEVFLYPFELRIEFAADGIIPVDGIERFPNAEIILYLGFRPGRTHGDHASVGRNKLQDVALFHINRGYLACRQVATLSCQIISDDCDGRTGDDLRRRSTPIDHHTMYLLLALLALAHYRHQPFFIEAVFYIKLLN